MPCYDECVVMGSVIIVAMLVCMAHIVLLWGDDPFEGDDDGTTKD